LHFILHVTTTTEIDQITTGYSATILFNSQTPEEE